MRELIILIGISRPTLLVGQAVPMSGGIEPIPYPPVNIILGLVGLDGIGAGN